MDLHAQQYDARSDFQKRAQGEGFMAWDWITSKKAM